MFNEQQELIIDRYKHPLFKGVLPEFDLTSRGENASCGDEVTFFIQVKEGSVTHISHDGRSCSICSASADLLAEKALGQPVAAIQNITPEEIIQTVGLDLSATREKCALLPLEVLKKAQV